MAEAEQLYGGPTKRFFVSMLTRDIDLDDAILDLIDNSVDGAMRQTNPKRLSKKPYAGFSAHIEISEDGFSLTDNCGGIPDNRLEAAFRLGRPQTELDADIPTIGMYGIGMKRSIFKMGLEASVTSSSPDGVREVTYTKDWLDDKDADADQKWDLEIEYRKAKKNHGVEILVPELRPEVAKQFKNADFIEELKRKIAKHFGYLLLRGFSIKINGKEIRPDTLRLYSANGKKNAINPFDYVTSIGKVTIHISVGFHRGLPPPEELDDEDDAPRTKDAAGILVICNDRVILDNDTTFRTGWGTRSVPKFHNQFMAISGIISFYSNDAESLPVSTTKTGVDMDSEVYDHALTVCAEGIKVFTSFTNKWKGRTKETAVYFERSQRVDPVIDLDLANTKGIKNTRLSGKRFKPDLPVPARDATMRRISFVKPTKDIEALSEYLFNEPLSDSITPSDVGGECFDRLLSEAKEA
jgi:hypothetical protein